MATFWKDEYPRNVGQNRRVNENDLSAANGGLGSGGGGLALGLDLTGTAATAQVLSFRAQAAYLHASATGIVIGPNLAAPANSTIVGQGAAPTSTGIRNVIIGNTCATALTTGDRNVVIGQQAMVSSTTVRGAVAVGYFALNNNDPTVSGNTGVGYFAGGGGVTGSNNTSIGYEAGPDANASNCTMVGYNANAVDDGCIAIGYFASAAAYDAVTNQAPFGIGSGRADLVITADVTNNFNVANVPTQYMRVNIDGTNYAIALWPEQ